MTEGSDMGSGRASSLTDAVPRLSRSTMARRAGSARAWNKPSRSGEWLSIYLSISLPRFKHLGNSLSILVDVYTLPASVSLGVTAVGVERWAREVFAVAVGPRRPKRSGPISPFSRAGAARFARHEVADLAERSEGDPGGR